MLFCRFTVGFSINNLISLDFNVLMIGTLKTTVVPQITKILELNAG